MCKQFVACIQKHVLKLSHVKRKHVFQAYMKSKMFKSELYIYEIAFVNAIFSVHWFYKRTAKALVRLGGRKIWSAPSVFAYAAITPFHRPRQ